MKPGKIAMRPLRLALFLPFLLFAVSGSAAADDGAGGFIQQLAEKVLPQLTDPSTPLEERKARFRAVMNRDFDVEKIGKLVLGQHWRRAPPAKREEFRKLLEDYISGLYARRFEDLAGLEIKVDGVRDFDGWSMVYTTATRANGAPVLLDWRVDSKDGRHAITDLVIEGVSMVIAQREEFSAIVLESGGLDGLMLKLRTRIAG